MRRYVCACAAALWLGAAGAAQPTAEPAPAPKSGEAAAPKDADAKADPTLDRKVTLSVREQPLAELLEDMAKQAEVKLEARSYLREARVTLRAAGTPLRQVLDALCGVHRWSYRKRGDTYLIAAVYIPPARQDQSLSARLLDAAPEMLRPYLAHPELCERVRDTYWDDLTDDMSFEERFQRGEAVPYSELSPETRKTHVGLALWTALWRLGQAVDKPMLGFLRWPEENRLFVAPGGWKEAAPSLRVVGADGSGVASTWHAGLPSGP